MRKLLEKGASIVEDLKKLMVKVPRMGFDKEPALVKFFTSKS